MRYGIFDALPVFSREHLGDGEGAMMTRVALTLSLALHFAVLFGKKHSV